MNQIDNISKEALLLMKFAKDTAITNLTKANSSGVLQPKLEPDQLSAVVNLVEVSLSQGYQRGLTSFQGAVNEQLNKKTISVSRKK